MWGEIAPGSTALLGLSNHAGRSSAVDAPERRLVVGFGRTASRDEGDGTFPSPKLSSERQKPVTDPAVAKGFGGQGRRSTHNGRLRIAASPFTLHACPSLLNAGTGIQKSSFRFLWLHGFLINNQSFAQGPPHSKDLRFRQWGKGA